MSEFLDYKYIQLVSYRLRNFKRKGKDLFQFSCHYCGDSSKNKYKARGFLCHTIGKGYYFYCHNCGESQPFFRFLRDIDPLLYEEYNMENFKEKQSGNRPKKAIKPEPVHISTPVFRRNPLKEITQVVRLPRDHYAVEYCIERKIPVKYLPKLYYAANFPEWYNSLSERKIKEDNHARLVIPFFDRSGNMHAFQGRALTPYQTPKYITSVVDSTQPKVFGLDRMDISKRLYIVEGPIDSMFLDNCIAMAGADLVGINPDPAMTTIVLDNERRNEQIVNRIEDWVEKGYSVCLWPEKMKQKDINDMVLQGYTKDQLHKIIDDNTFSGLSAKLELTAWKRT
jgi:hypothetical protein